MTQYVYAFGAGKADGSRALRNLLGGKGAGLAEMTNLGIPVPPGFTITTEVCTYYDQHERSYPEGLTAAVEAALARVEQTMGRKFGARHEPLLVSVRSGARPPTPGLARPGARDRDPYSRPAARGSPVELVLRSTPPGAIASIDGKRVGPTPAYWRGAMTGKARDFTFELANHTTARYRFVPTTDGVVHATLVALLVAFGGVPAHQGRHAFGAASSVGQRGLGESLLVPLGGKQQRGGQVLPAVDAGRLGDHCLVPVGAGLGPPGIVHHLVEVGAGQVQGHAPGPRYHGQLDRLGVDAEAVLTQANQLALAFEQLASIPQPSQCVLTGALQP